MKLSRMKIWRLILKSRYTEYNSDARWTLNSRRQRIKRNPYWVPVESIHDFVQEIYEQGYRDGVEEKKGK